MFAFLPPERWSTLQIFESHSYTFCFSDCACQMADKLQKRLEKSRSAIMNQHPNMNAIIQEVGLTLLQNPSSTVDPFEARDSILVFLCHNTNPCYKEKFINEPSATISNGDQSDVINIDENLGTGQNDEEEKNIKPKEDQLPVCIEDNHAESIMTFTRWLGAKYAMNRDKQLLGTLNAYGLLRHINSFMLKMISGDKVKMLLLSAHDRTIQNLAFALGLSLDTPFIPYASRLIFEVYKSETDTQFYFRAVYNGIDVTNQISFCEGGKSLRVSRGVRSGNKADLCPIENIIRFIHDDYFQPLNVTNFKDACYVPKEVNLNSFL